MSYVFHHNFNNNNLNIVSGVSGHANIFWSFISKCRDVEKIYLIFNSISPFLASLIFDTIPFLDYFSALP